MPLAMGLTREEMERREEQFLAPYAMKAKNSQGRVHPEREHPIRTAFQRDRDRIIHSTAFRRLEYKTQVFVNHEGDHFRTRLTHTIEVAQIARTLARALNVNEDLTEAVALVHDIGHTPFGHSGENALRELMKDHGGFEHNQHGVRVVDVLERRYPDFPGLNLTYEVRESIAKHKTTHDSPGVSEFADGRQPLLEAQIVDVADMIAYDSHDLDDGLQMRLIRLEELENIALWRRAVQEARRRFPDCSGKTLARQGVRFIINIEVNDVIAQSLKNLDAMNIRSVDDVRRAGGTVIQFSPQIRAEKDELEAFLFKKVYRHYRVCRMAKKSMRFLKELFEAYVEDPRQLPPEHYERVQVEGVHRVVCDYIAGMTDRYAQEEYRKLFSPYVIT